MSALSPEQLQAMKRSLNKRAEQLRNDIAAVRADLAGAPTLTHDTVEDLGEQGERRTHDALRGAEQDRDAAELREIAAALKRMDEGRYGSCVDCGVDIPLPRLMANPAVARCIDCQERYERMSRVETRLASTF